MDSKEEQLEWWETFDGILGRFKETIDENKALKGEIEELKKQINKRKKKTTKTKINNDK